MTTKVSAFIDSARTRARAIKARHEELGSSVTLAQAYELLAASEGHRTWAAMRAAGVPAAEQDVIDIHEDEMGWLFTVQVVRRISIDEYGDGGFNVPALLKAAYADLSYVFMDGEDHPAMRFRDTMKIGDDEYSVVVDIEGSPLRDMNWHLGRLKLAENVVRFDYGHYPHDAIRCDAVFPGSASGSMGNLRWQAATEGFHSR